MRILRRKTVDQRFSDTVEFIRGKASPTMGDHVVNTIAARLNNLPDPRQFVEALSLGSRFDVLGRDAETERRHYVRAVLLASGTLGDPDKAGRPLTPQEVEAKKTEIRDHKRERLADMLRDRLALLKTEKGSVSFIGLANSVEKNRAFLAINKVEEAVNRASMALMRTRYDAREMTRMRNWFGQLPGETGAGQPLSGKYQRLFQRLRSGVELIRDDDPAENNTFAYVLPNPADNTPVPRIFLCGAFWRATTVEWNRSGEAWTRVDNEMRNDNPLGVIIHEMTHVVLGTDDHEYGKTKCRALATSNPALARDNADNFEYFSEAVMLNDYS